MHAEHGASFGSSARQSCTPWLTALPVGQSVAPMNAFGTVGTPCRNHVRFNPLEGLPGMAWRASCRIAGFGISNSSTKEKRRKNAASIASTALVMTITWMNERMGAPMPGRDNAYATVWPSSNCTLLANWTRRLSS